MVDRSAPDVPLSHADEAEHRRLLALRVNALAKEEGQFTPEITFATEGDLSVAYTTQEGFFWRIGPLMFFSVHVAGTPTFTTSSGSLKITELPYEHDEDGDVHIFPVRLAGTGITYPANHTDIVGFTRAGENWIEIALQGSQQTGQSVTASEVNSGDSVNIFVTGFIAI